MLDYEWNIDSGDARPIAVKGINYSVRESIIMEDHTAITLESSYIEQMSGGHWMFKAFLAPKPHQESIYDIADFISNFSVDFIQLNQVTPLSVYPIPRYDTAISY